MPGDRTALMNAAETGNVSEVQRLLGGRNVDINQRDNDGWTALMLAVKHGHTPIVDILLQEKAAINPQNNQGWSALMIAAEYDAAHVVEALLNREWIEINAHSKQGWTALMIAAKHGHTSIVKALLQKKRIGINELNAGGWTALMLAAEEGHASIVEALLQKEEIEINKQNGQGRTAQILAAERGHASVVRVFLKEKDIELKRRHQTEVLNVFKGLETRVGRTDLMNAAEMGNVFAVETFQNNSSIDINQKDEKGNTALILAARAGHVFMVEHLLTKKDININQADKADWTALMVAAEHGHASVVEALLQRKDIEINRQNSGGWSALAIAAWYGHASVVKVLLKREDTNINQPTKDGWTALMLAAERGHAAVVEILGKTDINQSNNELMSPKLFAHINNDVFIAGTQNLAGAKYRETIAFLKAFLDNKGVDASSRTVLLPETVLTKEAMGFQRLHAKLASMLEQTAVVDNLRMALCVKGGSDKVAFHGALKAGIQPIVDKILAMSARADNKDRVSVLMPGGWVGAPGQPGHALVYEFKRDEEGNLLFLVYNSGAGIEDYHESVVSTTDNKLRYKTVQCYKIPAEKTIDKNALSFFIAELVKPQIFPLVPNKVDSDTVTYNATELYKHVFRQIAHLGGELIEVSDLCQLDPHYNDTVSIGQRSGTCAQKSLHELIKHSISNQKIGKLIIFSLKLHSIELFLSETAKLHKKSDDYAKNLSQLEWAKKKLAKKLSKMMIVYHAGNLPYEVQEIQARATKAIKEIEALCTEKNKGMTCLVQHIGETEPTKTEVRIWDITLDSARDPNVLRPGGLEKKEYQERKGQVDYVNEICQSKQFSLEHFERFKASLEALREKDHDADIEQQTFFYLTNCPLTPEYFQSINSPQGALKYVEGMHYILGQYILAVKNSKEYENYKQLTPKMVAAILSTTEAIELVYQNEKFNFIGQGEARGIEKFFDETFNEFKKSARLNPYLSTEVPDIDARIQAILNRVSPTTSQPSKIVNLESIKAYLNEPAQAKLKEYLETLYQKSQQRGWEPRFDDKEKDLIASGNYQAVIAYLHYLELNPGEFSEEAAKVALYKKTKNLCHGFFYNLSCYQPQEMSNNNLPQKFVAGNDDKNPTRLVVQDLTYAVSFTLNERNNVRHFNTIENKTIAAALIDQFSYQRRNNDICVANKIYSKREDNLYKALRYLRTEPDVQFSLTIDFFQRSLELFTNKVPQKKDVKEKKDIEEKKNVEENNAAPQYFGIKNDIRQYLRRNIFQPGVLVKAIKENENCLTSFHEFIQKAILYYSKTENNIENVLYFYQLQADVDNYVLNMKECPEVFKNDIRKLQAEMLQKLKVIDTKSIETELDKYRLSKIKLQLELNVTDKEDPKVLFDLLMDMGINYRNVSITSNEERESYRKLIHSCIERLRSSKGEVAKFALEWAREQGLLQSYLPSSIARWNCIGSYPYFFYSDESKKKMLSIDLTEGQILVEEKYVCCPPATLQNSSIYKEMQGKKETPRVIVAVFHETKTRSEKYGTDYIPGTFLNPGKVMHHYNYYTNVYEVTNYEVQGSVPRARFINNELKKQGDYEEKNKLPDWIYQEEKTIKGVTKFYEKRGVPTSKRHFSLISPSNTYNKYKINADLPETFYGQEMTFWVAVGTEQDILIERNNSRYFIKDKSKIIEELNKDNTSTGFNLISDLSKISASLKAICAKFEHQAFTEILVKTTNGMDDEIKIKFPRYNLELRGKYDVQQKKWVVHVADKPNLVLVDSRQIGLSSHVPIGLIFEDAKSVKEAKGDNKDKNMPRRIIYTPNQSYYADKPDQTDPKTDENLQSNTVYHQPLLDQTNINKRLELQWNVKELKTPLTFMHSGPRPEGAITYTNSEKYFTYTVSSGKTEVTANSCEEKLYLAYLDLINIKPKSALKNIEDIITKNGGLKGTVQELEIIDKIINGAPMLASEIDSPEFIAVRTHVLSLVSDLMEAKIRSAKVSETTGKSKKQDQELNFFSILNSTEISDNTFDNHAKKKHCQALEKFQKSMPELIQKHCLKALILKSNTSKELRLSNVRLHAMLSRISLEQPDLITETFLEKKYIDRRNWYIVRELENLKAKKAIRNVTEDKVEEERIKILEARLAESPRGSFSINVLEKENRTISVPSSCTGVLPLLFQSQKKDKDEAKEKKEIIEYFNQLMEQGDHQNVVYKTLEPGISDEDFLRNFVPTFKLAISKSDDEKTVAEQKRLHEFLSNILSAECLVEKGDEKSILSTWAVALLIALENKEAFKDIAPSTFDFYKKWSSNEEALKRYNNRYVDYVNAIFSCARGFSPRTIAFKKSVKISGVPQKLHVKKYKQELYASLPKNRHVSIETYKQKSYSPLSIAIENSENIYSNFSYETFIKNSSLSNFCIGMQALEDTKKSKEEICKKELRETIQKKSEEIKKNIKDLKEKRKKELPSEEVRSEKAETAKLSLFKETTDAKQKSDEAIGKIRNDAEKQAYELTKKRLNPTVQSALLKQCTEFNANLKTTIKQEKDSILELANRGPRDPKAEVQHQLEKAAFKRKQLALNDLNRLFILADMNEYRRVTNLDDADIQELHNKMSALVNYETLKSRYKNIAKELKKIEGKDIQKDECVTEVTELGKMLSARNTVPYNGAADYQFFQKEEKILIRPQQKFYLDKLLGKNGKGEFDNCVVQLIMGGGKSKVIGPLSVLKKANGTNLVIFEVKNSLLEVNFADMRATSERLFNQKAVLFDFDRNSKSSSADLQKIVDLFIQTSVDKNYIVTSASCLQALQLKYKETLNQKPIGDPKEIAEWEKQVTLFRELLLLLKQKGDRIIDEVHDELDPVRELNYTIGDPENPSKDDVHLSVNLFYFLNNVLIEDTKDKKESVFDLIKNNKNAKLIADPDSEIPKIMDAIAKSLVTEKDNPRNPIAKIIKTLNLNPEQELLLIAYLRNKKDDIYERLESKLSDSERQKLAFVKFELSKILSLTVVKNYNEHYGFSQQDNVDIFEKRIAIPYRAPGMPNHGSVFGLPQESINYTIQANIIEDLPEDLVSVVINDYLHRARAELLDSGKGKFENTQAYRDFSYKFGKVLKETGTDLRKISFLNQSEKDWNEILQTFKVDLDVKKSVLVEYILPRIKINPTVLSSNSQNLASMIPRTQGMSGTPYNHKAFHQDIHFNEYEGLGTDGETIDLLKDAKKDVKVKICKNYKSAEGVLTEVLGPDSVHENPKLKNARALIDVGALFKEESSNLDVAKSIGTYFKANDVRLGTKTKWVIYFDTNRNKLCALEVGTDQEAKNWKIEELDTSDEKVISEKLKCEPEERFFYFDQARTTGLDLKQAENAEALVTFNEHTTQSAFLQGVKRMRQFTNNQSVVVIEPAYMESRFAESRLLRNVEKKTESETKADDSTSIVDVLAFTKKNEVDSILPIHFKGAVQKIQNALHDELFDRVLNTADPHRQSELNKLFHTVFFKSYEPNHFKNHGLVDKSVLLFEYFNTLKEVYYDEWLRLLKDAAINPSEEEQKKLKEALEEISQKAIEDCDDTILSKPLKKISSNLVRDNLNTQNELQNEQQTRVETTTEEHIKIQTITSRFEESRKAFDEKNFEYNDSFSNFDSAYASSIDPVYGMLTEKYDIRFSLDSNIYFSKKQAQTVYYQSGYYSDCVKPMSVVMMIASKTKPNEFKCISLTTDELAYYTSRTRKALKDAYPNEDVWFVTPSGAPVYGSPPNKLPELYARALEQIRFINGDVHEISQQEGGIVWLNKETDHKMKFLEQVVLPRFPEKVRFYASLKAWLDVAAKIKREILDAPFKNYEETHWGEKYPMFDKLEPALKDQIHQLARALNEINSSYAKDYKNASLENKYDAEVLSDIEHHQKQVLDRRTDFINALECGNEKELYDLMQNNEYKDIDVNFTVGGKSLVEIAIERKTLACLMPLMPRLDLGQRNKVEIPNLELIVKNLSADTLLDKVLDRKNIEKYIINEEPSMNLICLAVRHNSQMILGMISEPKYVETFDSIEQLHSVIGLVKKTEKLGKFDENRIIDSYKRTSKYLLGLIKTYINNPSASAIPDFNDDNSGFCNIKPDDFDENLMDEIFKKPNRHVLNYLKKIKTFSEGKGSEKFKQYLPVILAAQNLKEKQKEFNEIINLLWEVDIKREDAFVIAVSSKVPLLILQNLHTKLADKAFMTPNAEGNTAITIAMSLNDPIVLENIKTVGGDAVRIKIDMLSNSFDHVNFNWESALRYQALSSSAQSQIIKFSEALQATNTILSSNNENQKLLNEEQYDPEIRALIRYYKENILKKRKEIVDCVKTGINLNSIFTPQYENVDFNVVSNGKNLLEIALENRRYDVISMLVKNNKINWENKKNNEKTNLEIILEHCVKEYANASGKNIEIILGKQALEKYIAHPDSNLNILSLSAKYKNAALLKMVFNDYISLFSDKEAEKVLEDRVELYAKERSDKKMEKESDNDESSKEINILLGPAIQAGSLLYKHQNSRKYVTEAIESYITEDKSKLEFKRAPFSTVNTQIFDKKFFDSILQENNLKLAEILRYLQDRGIFSDLNWYRENENVLGQFVNSRLPKMLEKIKNDAAAIEIINAVWLIKAVLEKSVDMKSMSLLSEVYNESMKEIFFKVIKDKRSLPLVKCAYEKIDRKKSPSLDLIVEYLSQNPEKNTLDLKILLDEKEIKEYSVAKDINLNLLFWAAKNNNLSLIKIIKDQYLDQFESFEALQRVVIQIKEKVSKIENKDVNKLLGDSNETGSLLYAYLHSKKHVTHLINVYIEEKVQLDFNEPPFSSLHNNVFDRSFIEATFKKPDVSLIDYFLKKGVFAHVKMPKKWIVDTILELPANSIDDESFKKIIDSLCETPDQRKDAVAIVVYKLLLAKDNRIKLEDKFALEANNLDLFVCGLSMANSNKKELKDVFDTKTIKTYLNHRDPTLNLLCLAVKYNNVSLLKEICAQHLSLFESNSTLEKIIENANIMLKEKRNHEIERLLGKTNETCSILYKYQHSNKYILETIKDYLEGNLTGELKAFSFDNLSFSMEKKEIFDREFMRLVFKKPNLNVFHYLKNTGALGPEEFSMNDFAEIFKAKNVSEEDLMKIVDIFMDEKIYNVNEYSLSFLKNALQEKKSEKVSSHCYEKYVRINIKNAQVDAAINEPISFMLKNLKLFVEKDKLNQEMITHFIDVFWKSGLDKKPYFSMILEPENKNAFSSEILKVLYEKLISQMPRPLKTTEFVLGWLKVAIKANNKEIIEYIAKSNFVISITQRAELDRLAQDNLEMKKAVAKLFKPKPSMVQRHVPESKKDEKKPALPPVPKYTVSQAPVVPKVSPSTLVLSTPASTSRAMPLQENKAATEEQPVSLPLPTLRKTMPIVSSPQVTPLESLKFAIRKEDEARVKAIIAEDVVISASEKADLIVLALQHTKRSAILSAIRKIQPALKNSGQKP